MPDTAYTRWSDHFFTTADGVTLHYRDYPAEGEVRGLPILCLHGLTRNVKDFDELAPQLANLGRRVIVVSQRGRGQSDWDTVPERYQPPVYAGDMIALLDALDLPRAVFVGTSMGGLITMVIATQQPERIAAFVVNDIGPELAKEGIDRIVQNVSGREPVSSWEDARERSKAHNLAAFPDRADDVEFWTRFASRIWIEKAPGLIELDYDPAITTQIDPDATAPDLWPVWEAFKTIPTLVVRGGISDLLTPGILAKMKAAKPDLESVDVPQVGHAPYMTEPEPWSAIEDFLGRVD